MKIDKQAWLRDGWKSFEKVIRGKISALRTKEIAQEATRSEQYVRKLMERSLQSMQASKYSKLTVDVFETHRFIIIRVHVPAGVNPRTVELDGDRFSLRISGIPGKPEETVRLPAPVWPRSRKAVRKGSVIEVTLKKRKQAG